MEECIHLLNNFTFSRIYFKLLFVGFWTIVSKMFSFQPPEQSGGLPTQVWFSLFFIYTDLIFLFFPTQGWFSSVFHYSYVQPLIVLKLFFKLFSSDREQDRVRIAWFCHGPRCRLPKGWNPVLLLSTSSPKRPKITVDVIISKTRLGKTTSLCWVSAT